MQSADLLVFPIDRRTELVRRTARELSGLHGETANAYWRMKARAIYQDLTALGHDDAQARSEIGRFSESVQAAMREEVPQELSSITG